MTEMLRSEALAGIPHGFPTRSGEGSADVLVLGPLVRLDQVHSSKVVTVTEPWGKNASPQADAMITDRPGLVLGIVTADCAPILLADSQSGIVGAAHAGWRGATSGVIANTVEAMVNLGARRAHIAAAIGPCIAQESYEVDEAMKTEFSTEDARFFAVGKPGHWQFDLPGFVASRLAEAGVGIVDDLRQDTYANAKQFFSFRRSTHRGERTGGRQLSMIGLHASA